MDLIVLFVLLVFCNAYAFIDDDRLNVGTVLFKRSDFNEKCWNAATIDLLEARKHLQDILPSPNLVDSINDDYLNHLLQYFNHSYDIIKRDIEDPATRNVMKFALSDAIGGYIKTWLLPVSKYSYYGGSISLENVLKVTKAYDDIKRELNTDGEGWRKDEDLVHYFPIDVAVNRRNSDFNKGSCDDLAYYEKCDSGYSVPVPIINWDTCPGTMFVPMKNPSLVPLDSANCSASLVNYYELIQNCVDDFDNWKDFDDRFQSWLMTDVAPHLNDDCLYVPFGGVLGLMNQSNLSGNFFKSLKSSYNKVVNSCNHGTFFFSGKKIIIAIIVFVEFVWCVPALYYAICCKKKKRKRRWSLLFCFKKKVKKNAFYVGTSTDDDTDSERNYYSSSSDQTYNAINDFQPSIYGNRYNICSDNCNKLTSFSQQHIPYLDSRQSGSKPLLKSQSSKTKPRDTIATECEQKKSIKMSKSRQSHKSKQSAPSSEKVLQHFNYSQYYIEGKCKNASENIDDLNSYNTSAGEYKNSPQVPQRHREDKYTGKNIQCPCANNIRDEANNKSSKTPKKKEKKLFRIRKRTIEVRREEGAIRKENYNTYTRKETAPKLHINIARPETEIKVDISQYKEYRNRNARPSRIPRFNAAGIKEPINEIPQKCLQPHWKRKQDIVNAGDIELEENHTEKLNATL